MKQWMIVICIFLKDFLEIGFDKTEKSKSNELRLRKFLHFREIERILPFPLPPSSPVNQSVWTYHETRSVALGSAINTSPTFRVNKKEKSSKFVCLFFSATHLSRNVFEHETESEALGT